MKQDKDRRRPIQDNNKRWKIKDEKVEAKKKTGMMRWLNKSNDGRRRQKEPKCVPTRDFGDEGAAGDVVRSSVLDGDDVAAGRHGRVEHLVAAGHLQALHLNLGRALHRHGHHALPCRRAVDDELRLDACRRDARILKAPPKLITAAIFRLRRQLSVCKKTGATWAGHEHF